MDSNLIYWTPICGKYFLDDSILENVGKYGKTAVFFRAATAGLGSEGLICDYELFTLIWIL